ncbi:MAG: hypothetical protein JO257_29765 [Deltaproteobacteria bacterium]|nr:hypothetical protein [Deltaproteobacteria bacterium]
MKVDEAQAKLAAAEAALAATQRERDEVARMIEERRRLPVLPNIRIASPCPADWNQMIGDSRVRACAQCNKNVFNLSAMTRGDAEDLIRATNGDLCAQYYQRKDGTILLADCTVQGVRRGHQLTALAAATAIAGTAWLAHATHPHRAAPPVHHERPPVTVQLRHFAQPPPVPPPPPAMQVTHELEPEQQMLRGKVSIVHDTDKVTR